MMENEVHSYIKKIQTKAGSLVAPNLNAVKNSSSIIRWKRIKW